MGDFIVRGALIWLLMALEGRLEEGGTFMMANGHGRVQCVQGRVRRFVCWGDEAGKLGWHPLQRDMSKLELFLLDNEEPLKVSIGGGDVIRF